MLIKKAADSGEKHSTIGCIYGYPGVGKTTLALSMPNPILIDCERGIGRVNAALRKDYVELNYIDEFNLAELQDYDTIIFDTFGVLLDMFDEKIKKDNPKLVKSDGALSLQGFGARKILFKQFLSDLRKSGKNVVFLAHVSEQKDGDITKYRPYATGSSINDLENDLDYMGFMEMRGQKRSISFTPGDQYVAKNSLNLPRYIEVPEVFADNHFMQELIVEGNKKRVAEEKANGEKYVAVITAASKIIADDKKDINEKTKEIMALEHIYDSKLRTWKALETLAAELGLTWDKGAKLWK